MEVILDFSSIKLLAKKQIKGQLLNCFLATIIANIFCMISLGLLFPIFSFGFPLGMGFIYLAKDMRDGKGASIGRIFSPFKDFVRTMLTNYLTWIFLSLWNALVLIPCLILYSVTESWIFIFIASILSTIIFCIKSLSYFMAPFILADNPNISPVQAITESRKIMNGHKMDLFLLGLSFIGWGLLVLITFGLLYIYVFPYMLITLQNFYDRIKNNESNTNTLADSEPHNENKNSKKPIVLTVIVVIIALIAIMTLLILGFDFLSQLEDDEGLEWSKVSEKEMIYARAENYCRNLIENDHDDWRVPTVDELKTIALCPKTTSDRCKVSEREKCLATSCAGVSPSKDIFSEKNNCLCPNPEDTAKNLEKQFMKLIKEFNLTQETVERGMKNQSSLSLEDRNKFEKFSVAAKELLEPTLSSLWSSSPVYDIPESKWVAMPMGAGIVPVVLNNGGGYIKTGSTSYNVKCVRGKMKESLPTNKNTEISSTHSASGNNSENQQILENLNNVEKVKLSFHIMSKCPYGAQVTNAIKPVLDQIGTAVDFELNYIGYEKDGYWMPMHGEAERQGDKLLLCAKKHFPKDYMNLIVCMNKDLENIPENFESCAEELRLNVAQINACKDGDEGENILLESYKFSKSKGANGSPTIFLAEQPYRGGRKSNDFLRAICNEYKTAKPEVCNSIPEPAKVKVTVISDKRCKECKPESLISQIKGMFPGLIPETLDYADEKAKEMYKTFAAAGFTTLPIVAFEESVEKAEDYQKIARWAVKVGNSILLRVGAKFDPTKEICDNGIDDTGNGKVDCADDDCKRDVICKPEIPGRLDLFIMSQCPYGIKALNAMKEVFETFKDDKLDFHINYIANETESGEFQSLHGSDEVNEDIRELCAIKHYPRDYMDYIWCRNENVKETEWQKCATGKIKADVMEKCFNGGEGVKLLSKNIKIGISMGIGGSPTWIFNNKFLSGGVNAEDIVRQICEHNSEFKGCLSKKTE